MFVVDFRNSRATNYNISVVGNKNVDKIYFYSQFVEYATGYDVYLKVLSEHYVDKILIDSSKVSVVKGALRVEWTMPAEATYDEKLQCQLQFETANDIAQTRIVNIKLGKTLDPESAVEPVYPSIIRQLETAVQELQEGSVADIDVTYTDDTLAISVSNSKHQELESFQFGIPTSESIVGATWNSNNNHKIVLTRNNGNTVELDLDNIFTAIGQVQGNLNTHVADKANPHEVTKAQVGLGNVVNTGDSDTPVANGTTKFTTGGAYTELNKKQNVIDSDNKLPSDLVDDANQDHKFVTASEKTQITTNKDDIANHVANKNNPHEVTKAQVGLGDVVNTGDSDTPVSGGTTKFTTGGAYTELNKKVDKVEGKGLSENDFTDSYKGQVNANTNARHTHANKSTLDQVTAPYTTEEQTKLSGIEANAQVNKLEGVQVNGTDLPINNKKVNIDLTGKVDKITSNNVLYGTNNSGGQTSVPYGSSASANAIPQRDNAGQVKVPTTPAQGEDATSKSYVDTLVANIKKDAYIVVDLTTYPTLNSFLQSTGTEGYMYLYPVNTSEAPTFQSGFYRYVWENNAWLGLGTTQTDLSDYYTKGETNNLLADKADKSTLNAHVNDTSNPHSVTKSQVGLGNVDNTSDADKPVSTAQQNALDLKANQSSLTAHTGNTNNPHSVTKAQVGLGNCDNTSDANKPISTATQTALDLKQNDVCLSIVEGKLCITYEA